MEPSAPKLSEEHNVAGSWVEQHYPYAPTEWKVALILAYGAGVDRGMAEAQEIIMEEIHGLADR